jgi:hypothetical protein
MRNALRIMATISLLLIVWTFRRTRGAIVLGFLAGLWLQRTWVTGPARRGALGHGGPPSWVRAAAQAGTGRALTSRTHQHTGSLFEAPPAKSVRWW